MDNDKPFKTIEVIDTRTSQVCKIACMSCIRGHRTTSCGIPVCRSKVFWTVKRPGRPSNSCTCRYGATGGCKCVVARSACPHKAKKGEKRSGECRCDEQGRYCCLLDQQHWDVLLALQKPTVELFPNREALEARHAVPTPMSLPMTPTFSGGSPMAFGSVPGTPAPPGIAQPMQTVSSPYSGMQSPSHTITPRFGMMGIGAPQGSEQIITPDVLSWDGQAAHAPRAYPPVQYQHIQQEERSSCCQGSASPPPSVQFAHYVPQNQQTHLPQQPNYALTPGIFQSVSMPQEPLAIPSGLNYEKFNNDYLNYQFPSAICQTCGLSGCTCRNCPPVMQNVTTGSWAQCCARKHARTNGNAASLATHAYQNPAEIPPPFAPQHAISQLFQQQQPNIFQDAPPFTDSPHPQQQPSLQAPAQSIPADFTTPFDPEEAFAIPEDSSNMDFSDLLMPELDEPPTQGCGCGCGDP